MANVQKTGSLRSDEVGSAFAEYLVLVGLFGLVMAGAFWFLGTPLAHYYRHVQLVWSAPFP